jgi:hypothetical protein
MATSIKLHWSFADDRHLMELAASSKSLEEAAELMNRAPSMIAKRAKRLGILLSSSDRLNGKGK